MMLVLLSVNLPLSFWSLQPAPEPVVVDEFDQHRSQIAQWKVKRDRTQRILDGLCRDRAALIEQLRRLGVASAADLKNAPEARPLAEELVEVARQAQGIEGEVARLDTAIAEAESNLRRIERREVIEANGWAEAEMIRAGLELSAKMSTNRDDLRVLAVDETLNEILRKEGQRGQQ
jgi:hypothetical protein